MDTDKRITKPFLTKYEKAKILSIRTQQIAANGRVNLDCMPLQRPSPYELAKMELLQKKTPIIICRMLPNGNIEEWKIKELK